MFIDASANSFAVFRVRSICCWPRLSQHEFGWPRPIASAQEVARQRCCLKPDRVCKHTPPSPPCPGGRKAVWSTSKRPFQHMSLRLGRRLHIYINRLAFFFLAFFFFFAVSFSKPIDSKLLLTRGREAKIQVAAHARTCLTLHERKGLSNHDGSRHQSCFLKCLEQPYLRSGLFFKRKIF